MDIRIEKKKGIRALFTKKGIPYLAGALFLVFVLWLLLRDNSSTLRVDARTISVGQVVSGEFNDYIRVTGQVQPITTVQLSPLEAGIVERLVVEEGTSVKKGDVLALIGELGTGKTALTRYIGEGLGIHQRISSPTFTIVKEYTDGRLPLYHFDVYRITDPDEMFNIGAEEYFFGEGVCVVEWADLIAELLPENTKYIYLQYGENPEERIYQCTF